MKTLVIGLLLGLPAILAAQEELTLEEKASLVTGKSSWETHDVPRLGIPSVWMADGPVGLRKSTGIDVSESLPATCFPSAAAMAATWNPALVERLGAGIGAEARFHDVVLLLGPGLNQKRHPLGGRNFEYYSEDPLLSGKMAAAFVRGVQSQGVGATVKHFAVNNQEYRRMTIDAQLDERTLREIYLRGFEIAVKEGRPQAVMSAYNRVNGTYASEDPRLLTEILRGEWGFEGLVVSDWGAVDDPVASVAAGLELEMPANPLTPARIVSAVQDGTLDEADLDRAVARVLQLVDRQAALGAKPEAAPENHDLAREVAVESIVLLENDGLLPLAAGSKRRIGVVGPLAFEPRIQGIGSSQINPARLDVPWDHIQEIGRRHGHKVRSWQAGGRRPGETDLARFLDKQDVNLIFAGQKASHDAEAWDRPSMSLADGDQELIAAARASGKPFVVVLVGGGVIDVRPCEGAGAVLMGWLGGQAFGSAVAQVIFGDANPSGKLSETFAWSVDDHPSALNFPGGPRTVRYGEGLYVGYRYFQSFDREVAYPFGHGLSYTTFEYADAHAPETLESLDEGFDVTVEVTNAGQRAGAEIVQVYLRHLDPSLDRPDRELAGFQKLGLEPGETRTFTVHVEAERLAYFHDGHDRWVIEPGNYEVLVGASAADVRATLPLSVTAGTVPRTVYTLEHTICDIYENPAGRAVIDLITAQFGRPTLSEAAEDDFFAAILKNLPFKKLVNFSQGAMTLQNAQQLLFLVNSGMTPEQITAMLEPMMKAAAEARQQEERERTQ